MIGPFVGYRIVSDPAPEHGPMPARMYEYLLAENGTFVQAGRPGMEARFCISYGEPVRGLVTLGEYLTLETGKVPRDMVYSIFLAAWRALPNEMLFYLAADAPWRVSIPTQVMNGMSVKPENPFDLDGQGALIELHSHNTMAPFFSATDNKDEKSGFRIYTVIGNLNLSRPRILSRIGIYGHFWEVPSEWIYDLPPYIEDAHMEPEIMETIHESD